MVGDLHQAILAGPTAAAICVPAHLHVSMALRLAAARIHLLIEKPLGTSLSGVAELEEVVDRNRIVAAVAYVHRANPSLAAMREVIHSGRFGQPVQLVATAGQHFPFYRPAYRETYYRDRATGGGAIQDALTHLTDAGQWLLGPIERLLADAAHQVLGGVDVEDTVHVIARHAAAVGADRSVPACYALNQHQAPNELTITVVCEGGTARYELHAGRWRWMSAPATDWHDEPSPALDRDDLFARQLAAFFDAIETRRDPLCTLREGVQALCVNLALLQSLDGAALATNQCSAFEDRRPMTPEPTIQQLFDLTGRTALVTGGTGHFGPRWLRRSPRRAPA